MMKSSPVIVLSGAGGGMPAPAPFRAGSGCLPGLRGAPYPLRLARILFSACCGSKGALRSDCRWLSARYPGPHAKRRELSVPPGVI